MKELVYIKTTPELPCNGCNRPASVAIMYELGRFHVADMICKDCAIHRDQVYNNDLDFLKNPIDVIELQEFDPHVTIDKELGCIVCSVKTVSCFATRSSKEKPHNMVLMPYCVKHKAKVSCGIEFIQEIPEI